MDFQTLRHFVDIVETGSFSRAAERNCTTQSAVSQRIKVLELELQLELLLRGQGKGRVIPTPAGKILYQSAVSLLDDIEALKNRMRNLSTEVVGTVRVATVYSVGLHALPLRLKPFLARHPQVIVHLEYSQTAKVYLDVLDGRVDVGIVACPAQRPGIEIVPFSMEKMTLICAPEHPFANLAEVRLSQLNGIPFVGFASTIPTRSLVDEQLNLRGIQPYMASEFDNIETIKNLVEIGSGVSIVPEGTVRQEVREGTLAMVHLAEQDVFLRPVGILLKQEITHRVAIRSFVEAMRD